MYSVLTTLSEYTYFYISKNLTSFIFLLVFKMVESHQCIVKAKKASAPLSKTINNSILKGVFPIEAKIALVSLFSVLNHRSVSTLPTFSKNIW